MKLVDIYKLCIGSYLGKNEDCVGVSNKYIFVIDGATCLNEVRIFEEYSSDAQWFANKTSEYLKNLDDETLSISQILNNAMIEIKKQFDYKCIEKGINIIDYPSAGICVFREIGEYIECFRLGDVLGIIEYNNRSIKLLQEKNLIKLDQIALKKQIEISKSKKITVKEAKIFINDILIKNRNLMNKSNGYFILEPKGEGIKYGETTRINKSDIKSLACMSDGYSCIVDTYKIVKDYIELIKLLNNGKYKELFKEMDKEQKNDKEYNKYPRFKMRDDSSIVFAKIK